MEDKRSIYLTDIAFRTNALLDRDEKASLQEVHQVIKQGLIIEWLRDRGCDMSILLFGSMDETKKAGRR